MKLSSNRLTACPRSSDPFYLLSWMAWSNKRVFSRCRVASSLMTQGRPPLLELVSENANNLYINYNKIGQHFLRLKIHWNWRREFYYSQWECSTVVLSIYLMILNREAGKVLANENVAYSLANVNELRWRITKTNIVDMFAILFVSGFSERTSLTDNQNEHSGYVRYFVR